MKLRKMIVSLALAALLCTALAVPAFAADVNLGEALIKNNDQQKGWGVDGLDGKASSLTIEDFQGAKYLVLELAAKPEGQIQVVWQGDGDGWGWNQTDEEKGEVIFAKQTDTLYAIDLAATLKNYAKFQESTQVKILICYYNDVFDDLGIQKAYLATDIPAGGGDESPVTDDGQNLGNKENPQTGDNGFLFIAIAALGLTACAATVLLRKKVTE